MARALPHLRISAGARDDAAAAARRSVRGDRRVWLAAAVLTTWLVAYGMALGTTNESPVGRLMVQSGLSPVPTAAAALLTGLAAHRATGRDRRFWAAMACYCGLWLAGELVWSALAVAGTLPAGREWPTTALHLASYGPIVAAALYIGGRPRMPNGIRGLFDMAAVAVALSYTGYVHHIAPALADHGSAHVFIDAGYPVLDGIVLVLALSTGVVARRHLPLSRILITGALLCFAVLDAAYSTAVDLHGSDGHWLDLGWALQACLICLAAVLALRHHEVEGSVRTLPGRWSMIALLVVCLPVLQLTGSRVTYHGGSRSDVVVAGVVFLTLVVRSALSNNELRRVALRLDQARLEQERLAVTDGLTGLYNRRFFEEFLTLEAERSARHGAPLSLIVADLDHFKWVNDEHGHPAGDEVLVQASARLRAAVRGSDVVARYGGEEFAVVLPETDPDTALEVAERCRRALADSAVTLAGARPRTGRRLMVTGSFGIATLWPNGERGVDDLVRATDRALYRAKSTGRNRIAPAGEWDFLTLDDATERAADTDPVAVALLRAAELIDADRGPDQQPSATARWAGLVADRLHLDPRTRTRCVLGARLRDVGTLAIPASVLHPPEAGSAQDEALLRTHPEQGEALVNLSTSLAELGPAIRSHHERFDGTGYPDSLAGTAIPVEARIIAVCDAWAQLRGSRGDRPPPPVEVSRAELRAGRGHQFDPDVVDAFLHLETAGLVADLVRTGSVVTG